MKLAVVREGFNVACGGRIYTNNLGMHFFARLAPHFESVTILSGLRRASAGPDGGPHGGADWYPLDAPGNVRFVDVFCCGSVAGFYRKLPLVYRRNAPVLRRELARADAALLSISGGGNALLAFSIARRLGKPVFLYITSNLEKVVSEGFKYRGFARSLAIRVSRLQARYVRWMARRSAEVFYFGSELKRSYPAAAGRGRVAFASSIDDGDLAPPRERFLDPDRTRLIYVGRLAHEKGLHILLEALAGLAKRNAGDADLVLCGGGRERAALEAAAQRLGIAPRVCFAGFVPPGAPLHRRLDAADVFVLPSISEGVPKVLLEAMARGLPVVASNVGGVPDVVAPDGNGLLVEPGDAGAIARAVERLRADEDLFRRLSIAAVRFAGDHTADKQAARIAEAIHRAAALKEARA